MRRFVRSVSSNVQLPVLPDARMEMRNGIGYPGGSRFLLRFPPPSRIFAEVRLPCKDEKSSVPQGNPCGRESARGWDSPKLTLYGEL